MDEFRRISTEDRETLKTYLDRERFRACDYSAGNLVLWSGVYDTCFAVAENTLFIRFRIGGKVNFTFPMGTRDLRDAFTWLRDYCGRTGVPFHMSLVEPEMFERVEAAFPGEYKVSYNRNSADYIYHAGELANFSGKRYHSKKNHVNEFRRTYPGWSYEPVTDESTPACIEMTKAWCAENGCCGNRLKSAEMCVLIKALQNRTALGLSGGYLLADGRIVALALGERCGDMLIEHFEKAFAEVPGAYPMICQQYVLHEAGDAAYVNREEDMGVEGLRQSKESYRPAFMADKGVLATKTGAAE